MAEQLTLQQQQAVTDRGGNLLVSAAAGSGKTKVLVDRLLSYLTDAEAPANVDDFLIITYTKAAASELRGKIASKLSERIAELPQNHHLQRQMQRLYLAKISTVHSFCSDILREYAYKLDISADFRVAEETECLQYQTRILEQLLNEVYDHIGEDSDLQTFVDSQGFGRNDGMIPRIILKVYDSAMCHLDPIGWLDKCIDDSDTDGLVDAGETLWGKYLIDQFKSAVNGHILALEQCIGAVSELDGFAKISDLLKDTVFQLEAMVRLETWDQIAAHPGVDFGTLRFSKGTGDTDAAYRVKAIRNACKEHLAKLLKGFADKSERILEDLAVSGASARGLVKLVKEFGERYSKLKRTRRIMDFTDLEHYMLRLLFGKNRTGLTAAATEIGDRFREIMVDEYQDSNSVQDAIFSALTRKRNNCFMVGDVKQSIYQFRLADPGIFLEKYDRYVPVEQAQNGQARKVLLSKNFRSAGPVIAAVNDVFSGCMSTDVGGLDYGEQERLYEGIPHVQQSEPEIEFYALDVQEDTYDEESAFVAQRISELLDGTHFVRDKDVLRPIKPEDIVILLRSPGSVGADFCYALEQRGIRCTMGGGVDLLQTEEIRIIYALLQTIYNPMVDIPLVTVLSSRVFGFKANDLASIRSKYTGHSFYHALKKDEGTLAKSFLERLEELRQFARMNSLSGLIQKIISNTRLDSIYAAMPDGVERVRNIKAFTQYISAYESTGAKELGQLLSHLEAVAEKGLSISAEQGNSGCVTVMSIHKSKGLEFPVVFLSALSRRFNHDSATAQVLCHKDMGLGLCCVDPDNRVRYPSIAKKAIAAKIVSEDISEEMRVLYVALTRAKDRLIMTYAAKKVEEDIADVACRIDYSGKGLLSASATCPGQWVLQTVVKRTEAGGLLQNTVTPDCRSVSEQPWKIELVTAKSDSVSIVREESPEQALSSKTITQMHESLNYKYPYASATVAPSKQTATQLKGRVKDSEAAENTNGKRFIPLQFRKPGFAAHEKTPVDFGNTVHIVMEHIQYDQCTDVEGVKAELMRICQDGFIKAEDAQQIDPKVIYGFFETELGKKMMKAHKLLREFKFSVLVGGADYSCYCVDDKVLLQGVVDCALIEEDGVTVVDFKTDRVTEDTLEEITDAYRFQVKAYTDALTRIYNKPIKASYLYFFRLNRLVPVL